jgi:chromosome segregation ATPase
MEKILARLNEITGFFPNLTAALSKLTTAEERVKALEVELDTERKAHAETKAALQTAQDQVNTQGTEIKNLQVEVATEKQRATETIASQGLAPDQVPTGSTGSSDPKVSAWKRYQDLLAKDAKAAGEFYSANAESILSSRPK